MIPSRAKYSSLPVLRPVSPSVSLHEISCTRSSSGCNAERPQSYPNESCSLWRSAYVTKKALAAFLITFSALTAGIQLMLFFSKQNHGLSGDKNDLHRVLWTYGPTAVLTLVASFWTCVESQTKTIAPWINMTRGFTTARKSLLLDYLSQIQIFSITSAIRNKDHTVAALTFISVLLKVLLVLSTSLCSLSPTEVVRSKASLILKSEFVNNPAGLAGNGSLAYASLASNLRFGTSLPRGTSDQYAYQLIESDFLDTPSTISTTLDGFIGDFVCDPASMPDNTTIVDFSYGTPIPIWSDSCSFNITPYSLLAVDPDIRYFVGLEPGGCGGSNNIDDKRFAIVIMEFELAGRNDTNLRIILNSNSFMCRPGYEIQQLDFSARNSDRLVSISKEVESRVLSNVHPWSIMQSHFDGVALQPINTDNRANISNQTVSFNQYGFLAYLFANASGDAPDLPTLLEDQEGAKSFFLHYYRQYAALLAHGSLMQPISRPVEGTVIEVGKRLQVRDAVANSMTGVLAFCIITLCLILVFDRSPTFALPQMPHSIIGIAACLSSSPLLLEKFQGLGSTGYPTLRGHLDGWLYKICTTNAKGNANIYTKECLASNDELEIREPENSQFKPASLSTTARITVALLLVGVASSLEVTLRISTQNDGLGNVPSGTQYISYLWTALPTVVFTFIGMYCSSADFDTRSLAPYLHLARASSFRSSIGLELFNKHPLLLFYTEIRTGSSEAVMSTLAVTLTSFLTIFSAGLFSGAYFSTKIPLQLNVADFVWYNTWGSSSLFYPDYSLAAAALVLGGNLTYPSFTYEDLIFPQMKVDQDFLTRHPNSSNIEFSGTFTAARPSFANCRLYDSSQVRLNLSSWPEDPEADFGIPVIIEPEQCFGRLTAGSWNLKVRPENGFAAPISRDAYFGVGVANSFGEDLGEIRGCSQRLWTWGQWTSEVGNESVPHMLSISALGCNESMEAVDVTASFFGPGLDINPKSPPITNESSTTAVDAYQWDREDLTDIYLYLPPLSTNMTDRIFDTFFTLLTTSRYAVPMEMIGDKSEASAVAEAIKFHHRVMVAQETAATRELFAISKHETSANDTLMREWAYEIVPGTNKTSSYNVTGSIPSDRYRVVQDELSTRFLQGLLVAALICCLVNWYLIHVAGGCKVVPRRPTTIANVAALLADSNILELMPAEKLGTSASIKSRKGFGPLEEREFRLGWREVNGDPEQVYSIYMSSTK